MRPEDFLTNVDPIDEDLRKLDLGIRQLKLAYDQYFAGAMKRPPHRLQGQVRKIITRYLDEALPKYQHRFLYNSLVTRYNVMADLWAKRIRDQEEGPRVPGVRERVRPAVSASSPRRATGEQLLARCLVEDAPAGPSDSLRALYARFVEARRAAGVEQPEIGFDRFQRGVASQAERLRAENGCQTVELRLVAKAGQVELRARPA